MKTRDKPPKAPINSLPSDNMERKNEEKKKGGRRGNERRHGEEPVKLFHLRLCDGKEIVKKLEIVQTDTST